MLVISTNTKKYRAKKQRVRNLTVLDIFLYCSFHSSSSNSLQKVQVGVILEKNRVYTIILYVSQNNLRNHCYNRNSLQQKLILHYTLSISVWCSSISNFKILRKSTRTRHSKKFCNNRNRHSCRFK